MDVTPQPKVFAARKVARRVPTSVVAQVQARSGGRCEAHLEGCEQRAVLRHHLVRSSQGGPDLAGNLLDLCNRCHLWVHANPAEARARGLLGSGHG